MLLKLGGVTIAGVRSLAVSGSDTPIDITNADSAGVRKFLAESASTGLSISVEGVETDGVLATIQFNPATSKLLTNLTLTMPGQGTTGDVLTGNFFMTNYEMTGPYDDAVTFKASFESSGTFVAA